jgi:hypothetical protein
METFAWVLIAFLIIIVIIVVAWILYKYFNRNKLIDLNNTGGGGGGGGPVPDNFSSLYNRLQPLIKTMNGQVNDMTKWFNELEKTSTCVNILKGIKVNAIFDQFITDWKTLEGEATLPVSIIYNDIYETLLSSTEATGETIKKVVTDFTTLSRSPPILEFCNKDLIDEVLDAGEDASKTLEKINTIVVEMVKIAREDQG